MESRDHTDVKRHQQPTGRTGYDRKSKSNRMNYLAHLYLSGDSDEVMIGNFIGDYVKGNKYLDYPGQVAYGIRLHRSIDTFTDQHELVRECIRMIRPGYGRWSGIVTDIFFDHFLAHNWLDYSDITLNRFTRHAHRILLSNFTMLPLRVKQFLPFLIHHKRLESYAERRNIFHVLEIMSNRTSLPSNSQWAVQLLESEYDTFGEHFRAFFAEMTAWIGTEFGIPLGKPAAGLPAPGSGIMEESGPATEIIL